MGGQSGLHGWIAWVDRVDSVGGQSSITPLSLLHQLLYCFLCSRRGPGPLLLPLQKEQASVDLHMNDL